MVYKVTKGGVRSGNTLRCISFVNAKRYSRQTCIVSRSNLCPEEIPKLLDSSEDTVVNSTLSSTDVILSLNKKARWRVPAEISHMIKTGHFNKGKTMVSFLERHKLKRTANCIRFVSNQERHGQVTPRQRKYFSFNLNNIDRDLSNRKVKHLKGAKVEQSPKVRLLTDNRKDIMKTVEVFTVSGSGKAADVKKCLVSSKPEYRIEVFYPSPKSCSLTYNPKYTDVHMEFGQDGKMEIKSNAKPQKGTRRHRKRFSLKDLRLYEEELNANGDAELWYAEIDENDENDDNAELELEDVSNLDNKHDCENLISLSEKETKNELRDKDTQLFDNTIASFIVQAEKESHRRNLVPQGKKHFHRHSKEKECSSRFGDKSHIVHISETRVNETQDNPLSNYNKLHAAKVILRSSEINQEKLRATFGCWYQEGNSEPRRFTINMTDDVNNLLNPINDPQNEGTFIAHLIFVHDGKFDEDLDVFKVIFNSNCCKECLVISNTIPLKEMPIHEIINWVVSSLNDMALKKLLSTDHAHDHTEGSASVADIVHTHLMESSVHSRRFLEVLENLHITEKSAISHLRVNILKDSDYDIFCDRCYENIDSVSWTRLLGCDHLFCDECWRSHFRSTTKKENVHLTCPASNCDVSVDVVTLLSLLHVSEVSQLLVRALEDDQSSSNWKLCPAPDCGRIVRHVTEKSAKFDVLCSCGHGFCFLCLSEPHWPCECKQARKYFEELRKLKPVNGQDSDPESDVSESAEDAESNEEEVFEIESRICPKCSSFIEKDGGCSHMICKCGYEFCWKCVLAWDGHNIWKCDPSPHFVLKYTQKVTVRHLTMPKLFTLEGEYAHQSADACHEKATMYSKALEQRWQDKRSLTKKQIQEIVRKIYHITQRGLLGKKEILTICGVQFSDMADSKLDRYLLLPALEKFLRSCEDSKREAHRIAEFTFVLLKDTPASAEKKRALRLLQDLLGYCSFMKSVLQSGPDQDLRVAIRQLAEIRKWSRQTMATLVSTIRKMK